MGVRLVHSDDGTVLWNENDLVLESLDLTIIPGVLGEVKMNQLVTDQDNGGIFWQVFIVCNDCWGVVSLNLGSVATESL